MQKHICLTLIGVLICSARPTANLPHVACPQHFRYVTTPLGNVKGVVTVPYNSTKMNLEVKAVVDGIGEINEKHKMAMKLTLLTSDDSTATYQLVFSLGIPQITSVVLNGQEYCNMDQKSSTERGIILAISHTFPEITVNKRPKRDLPSVGLLTEDDLPYEGTKRTRTL